MKNTKKYDLAVYIGRFQPFHNGHQHVIERASQVANRVLVLIGSSNSPRTPKNPWTADEREFMIRKALDTTFQSTTTMIDRVPDSPYDEQEWVASVERVVAKYTKGPSVALIGHDKDESSYYLNSFPQWDVVNAPSYDTGESPLSSTTIRKFMFERAEMFAKGVVPEAIYKELSVFPATEAFANLREDYRYIEQYKASWASAPYPPIFVTADAVVVQSGHILLVQRGEFPGRGLWALPGGFVNANETVEASVIRELREETRLKVPEKVLKGSIRFSRVFDKPSRSSRGRTITHAFGFRLDDSAPLPDVRGGDDAANAKWVSIGEFFDMETVMFEDHYAIVKSIINQI